MKIIVKGGQPVTVALEAAEKRTVAKFRDILIGLKEHGGKELQEAVSSASLGTMKIYEQLCRELP